MNAAASHAVVLIAALALDRLIGEPDWLWRPLPHPVAAFGALIAWLDGRLNDPALPATGRRRRGVGALALFVLTGGLAGLGLERLLSLMPAGPGLEAVLVAVLLAHKSLVDHVAAVAHKLRSDGLAGGRAAVSLIVGRDVSVLDEAGVSRAAIESAAENFSDGVVAPAFWYVLLGLPGLIVFKAVSTADSMIGHRSPRHEAFGWASARLDDLLNLAPARLSAALITAAAALTGHDARAAAQAALRDGRLHKSPNAGWPEAAAAGALGLALGGPRRYGERVVDGAWLNPGGRKAAGAPDISAAIRLIDAAWAGLMGAAAVSALLALAIAR